MGGLHRLCGGLTVIIGLVSVQLALNWPTGTELGNILVIFEQYGDNICTIYGNYLGSIHTIFAQYIVNALDNILIIFGLYLDNIWIIFG